MTAQFRLIYYGWTALTAALTLATAPALTHPSAAQGCGPMKQIEREGFLDLGAKKGEVDGLDSARIVGKGRRFHRRLDLRLRRRRRRH